MNKIQFLENELLYKVNNLREKNNMNKFKINNIFKKNLSDLLNNNKLNEIIKNKEIIKKEFNLDYSSYNDFHIIYSMKELYDDLNYLLEVNTNYILNSNLNQICIYLESKNSQFQILILFIKKLILIEEIKITTEIKIKGILFDSSYSIKRICLNNNFNIDLIENNLIGGNFLFLEKKFPNIILTNTIFKFEIFFLKNYKEFVYNFSLSNNNYQEINFKSDTFYPNFNNGFKTTKSLFKDDMFSQIDLLKYKSNSMYNDNNIKNISNNNDSSIIIYNSIDNDTKTNKIKKPKKSKNYTLKINNNSDIISNIDNRESRDYNILDKDQIKNNEIKDKNKLKSVKNDIKLNMNYDYFNKVKNNILSNILNNIKDKNIYDSLKQELITIIDKEQKDYKDLENLITNIFLKNKIIKRDSRKNFEYYYNKENISDFDFILNNKKYKVHSFVLIYQSDFFKNLFENNDINKSNNVLKPQFQNYNNFLINNNTNKNNYIKNSDILDLNDNKIDNALNKINNLKYDYKINSIKFNNDFKEKHLNILLNYIYKNDINFNYENIDFIDIYPLLTVSIIFELKELIAELSYLLILKLDKDNLFDIILKITSCLNKKIKSTYQIILLFISILSLTFHLKILLESKQYDIVIKNKIMKIFENIDNKFIIDFIEFYIIYHRRITDFENEFFINILMIGYNNLNISNIINKYIRYDESIISYDTRSINLKKINFITNSHNSYLIYNYDNYIFKTNDFNQFIKKPEEIKFNFSNINKKDYTIEFCTEFKNNTIFLTNNIDFYQGGLKFLFEVNKDNLLSIYILLNDNMNDNFIIKNFIGNSYGTFNIYIEIYDNNKITPKKTTQFLLSLQKNSNQILGQKNFLKINNEINYNIKIVIKEDFILNNLITFLSNNIDSYIENYINNINNEQNYDYMSIIEDENNKNEIIKELLKNEHFKINNNIIDYNNLNHFYMFSILLNDNLKTKENKILLFINDLISYNEINSDILLSSLRFYFIDFKIILLACMKNKNFLKEKCLLNYLNEKLKNNKIDFKEYEFYYNKKRNFINYDYDKLENNYINLIDFLKEYDDDDLINKYEGEINLLKKNNSKIIEEQNDLIQQKDYEINNLKEENYNYKIAFDKINQQYINKKEENKYKYESKSKLKYNSKRKKNGILNDLFNKLFKNFC